jgi:hypothetical protein
LPEEQPAVSLFSVTFAAGKELGYVLLAQKQQ